jgi:hypothetical protein
MQVAPEPGFPVPVIDGSHARCPWPLRLPGWPVRIRETEPGTFAKVAPEPGFPVPVRRRLGDRHPSREAAGHGLALELTEAMAGKG